MELLENILRLRAAERAYPENRDIAFVRFALETELGPTVAIRLAARFLGVSHTALARWIASGDVPVVTTGSGRRAVPVPLLLRLRASVDRERRDGERGLHVLEPVMAAARVQADELDVHAIVSDDSEASDPHDRAAMRSLAYHRALAGRLDRATASEALHAVWKWREQGKIDPRYADRWEAILNGSLRGIETSITEDSDRGRDLRQNSPFAGMLGEPERQKIVSAIR